MKKAGLAILIALTVLYVAVLAGLLINQTRTVGLSISAIPTAADGTARGKVNLNTATARELMVLPGIGEGLANRIIAYRELHGPFRDITELIDVKGISERMFKEIADYITVGG